MKRYTASKEPIVPCMRLTVVLPYCDHICALQSPSAAPESVGGFAVAATKRNQSEITNISGPQPTHLVSNISLLPIVTVMSASCMPGAG